MTKKDFVAAIHSKVSGFVTKEAVSAVLIVASEVLAKNIESGETVPFLGMGSLKLVDRRPRQISNPQDGKAMLIPARKVVKYTPSAAAKRLTKSVSDNG